MFTQAAFEKQYRACHVESCNRSLRTQHHNKAQERLMHLSTTKAERDLQREVKATSTQKEALLKELEGQEKLSPSIDQWMKERGTHLRTFQDRERERLMSRHGRGAKAGFRQRAFSDDSADIRPLTSSKGGRHSEDRPGFGSHSLKERESAALNRSGGFLQRRGSAAAVRVSRTVSLSDTTGDPDNPARSRRHSLRQV